MRRITMLVVCTLALALSAAAVTTPPPADTLKIDYFANANSASPDATLRITNPGTSGTGLCAAIFVFDAFQEMSECCSCYVSPDGLRTLSVNGDLTSNPLIGPPLLATGAIKIVSTRANSGTCPNPTSLFPTAAIRAWATHIQDSGAVTETASQDATFSATEQNLLQNECHAIHLDGSGRGVCSCGTGD